MSWLVTFSNYHRCAIVFGHSFFVVELAIENFERGYFFHVPVDSCVNAIELFFFAMKLPSFGVCIFVSISFFSSISLSEFVELKNTI